MFTLADLAKPSIRLVKFEREPFVRHIGTLQSVINENLPKEIEKLPLHLFGESGTDSSSESSDSVYSDVSSEVEYITKYIDPPKIACSSISTQCEPTIDGIPIEEYIQGKEEVWVMPDEGVDAAHIHSYAKTIIISFIFMIDCVF